MDLPMSGMKVWKKQLPVLEPAQIFDVSSQFANKSAQQRAEEDLHGYVCFVSLMNSSFAPPSCSYTTWEQQAVR